MIDRIVGLEKYAVEWDQLAYSSPQRLPMLSHAWVTSFLEHQLTPSESWFCLLALQNDELQGVLPLILSDRRVLLTSRPSLRTPSGPHLASVDVLMKCDKEQAVISCLLTKLQELVPNYFQLCLGRLPETSPSPQAFECRPSRVRVIQEFDGYGSYLRINGSYDRYYSELKSAFRKQQRSRTKRLEALGKVETVFLAGEDASEKLMEDFFVLEASGWKGRTGSAIVASEGRRRYYEAFIRRLRLRGWLEWHFLRLEGKAIAGMLGVKMNGALIAWKMAYDEGFSHCSPGILLLHETVRRAFESGDTDEINGLSNATWLKGWSMQRRSYFNLTVYPPRLLPFIAGVVPKKTKAAAKRIPGVHAAVQRIRTWLR
jgi:CelD/BcsL family acetyltransferase involved in cellulose biosynthesis